MASMIPALGGLVIPSDEEFARARAGTHLVVVEVMLSHGANTEPDEDTRTMIFDGGLLWGGVFRRRYPDSRWNLAREPKSSVHYGNPVVVSNQRPKAEFDRTMELTGFVFSALFNTQEHWTISKTMKFRASRLGLGPEPGLIFQRVWCRRLTQC